MARAEVVVHRAKFERVTEHGAEFFRVTCLDTGEQAQHFPQYLRTEPLTVWDDPWSECALNSYHQNVNRAVSVAGRGSGK